jgi:hypothetical protein
MFGIVELENYFIYYKNTADECKVKVKLSLCLTKHHTMKIYCGSEGIAPRIL